MIYWNKDIKYSTWQNLQNKLRRSSIVMLYKNKLNRFIVYSAMKLCYLVGYKKILHTHLINYQITEFLNYLLNHQVTESLNY